MITWGAKDPDEVESYAVTFADRLATGETIESATWDVPAGITKESDALADPAVACNISLSGGTANAVYELTVHVVTSTDRELDERCILPVVER